MSMYSVHILGQANLIHNRKWGVGKGLDLNLITVLVHFKSINHSGTNSEIKHSNSGL